MKKKRHWFWNTLIVLTLITVLLAFLAHYKNWTRIEEGHFKVLSGVYYKKIPLSEINSVTMVEKIPSMERINGFSAMAKEKGVFKDSLTQVKTYVYVDNLAQHKIKIQYQDSLYLFFNYADSTDTATLYKTFSQVVEGKAK
ncbi:hypothetical protein [Spongiimicrobium salis]|uniref:hypothetical protein n=1 Tax=Spongiimicrobium salis TaxID=1667022 RepID=UPI00374D60C6